LNGCRFVASPNDYWIKATILDRILEATLKFICLGYMDETKWDEMSEVEQTTLMEKCFAFEDELRKGGNFLGGEALQSIRNTATLRYQNGKVTVTDGPFTETKEQLGGFVILEARDLNYAIGLMSKHPGVLSGSPFEIRPVDEAIDALAKNSQS
jgi:hypothetical protein